MRRLLLATSVLFVLLPAGGAIARDRPQDLLIDACRDEQVDGTYSQRTYRRALDQLPADSDQYTACRDVINRARLAALNNRNNNAGDSSGAGSSGGGNTGSGAGGGARTGSSGAGSGSGGGRSGGGGSSSGSSDSSRPSVDVLETATPKEQNAVKEAAESGSGPVRIGGQLLQPGAVGSLSNGHRDLPTSLVIVLAALGACLLAAAGAIGWNRVLVRRAR